MSGNRDRSEQVITIFSEMLQREQPERKKFIAQKCADDQELYSELSEMLEWEDRMGGFLKDPLVQYIDFDALEQRFQPGQLVANRFTILRFVASGGMGVVYEAFDEKLQSRIALKCPRPGFAPLLTPELEAAIKVRHRNICSLYDTHTENTHSGEVDFLTMEFIDGETLDQRLRRHGKLKPEQALEIGRQLCAGVAAAHEAGIIHRDLKPGNILLARKRDGTFRTVITDFGLATEARLEVELQGGTPRYMAPELRRGDKPSNASDVYALGVILYEMVTGEPPFKADHWDTEPGANALPPNRVNKALGSVWNKAILPCLQPSPAARPQAADIFKVFDRRPWWKSPGPLVAILIILGLVAAFQRPLMRLFQPANIRLAILPLQAPPDLQEFGSGVLQDVADRIMRSRGNRATVVVIPAADVLKNKVVTPQDAAARLHATDAVEITLRGETGHVVVEGSVVELSYNTQLRHFEGIYSQETIGNVSGALAEVIASALHLGRAAASDVVSPVA
ncbi:MAG TPA: serine/threonine-protein kinase, partial [Candidatus Angelobacter sp.]|nr:serine/threonine-protein kinase [Candidatus Angelobacter sp.]